MKNYLNTVINDIEKKYLCNLKPTKEFYKKAGIKQKLFGQIVRNEKQPTTSQAYKLCEIFKIPIEKLVELPKQLEMFEPEYKVIRINIIKEIKEFYENKLGNKQKEEFANIINQIVDENK